MRSPLLATSCPESLIEELAARRCILFLGSGVSATSQDKSGRRPSSWKDFIEDIKHIIKDANKDILNYVDEQIKKENYLLALQAIYDSAKKADYTRFLENEYKHDYIPSEVHHYIQKIDSKIVITTNFDNIYETLCHGSTYTVMNYSDSKSIVHALKSPQNLIIKAHGTIDKPDDIIFTASQYYESQEKYPDFYSLLAALFLTNTVVFLGYSLSDPDINLILQFLHRTATDSSPHYLITKSGTPLQLKDHWKKVYNVEVVEYGDKHEDFFPAMEYLLEQVDESRVLHGIP